MSSPPANGDEKVSKEKARELQKLKRSRQYPLTLKYEALNSLKLKFKVSDTNGSDSQVQEKLLFEWYTEIVDGELLPEEKGFGFLKKYKTKSKIYAQELGNMAAYALLEAFLTIHRAGVELRQVWWYFVAEDSSSQDPTHCLDFFISDGKSIIIEELRLFGELYPKSLWDYFDSTAPDDPLWFNADSGRRAHTRWLYSRYFKETTCGQIEQLRLEIEMEGDGPAPVGRSSQNDMILKLVHRELFYLRLIAVAMLILIVLWHR